MEFKVNLFRDASSKILLLAMIMSGGIDFAPQHFDRKTRSSGFIGA
jgi:hypothetical protein